MTTEPELRAGAQRFFLVLFLLAVVLGGSYLFYGWVRSTPTPTEPPHQTPATPAVTPGATPTATAGGPGMTIRLSDGQPLSQPMERLPVATTAPLAPGEIEQIARLLPPLAALPGDQVAFNLPPDPLPPPLPGQTLQDPFPLPENPPTPNPEDRGPLTVLRFSPQGEIPPAPGVSGVAPFISVTFSQPMAPLATLEDLAQSDVPVQVSPAVPGAWRWLGTNTLVFRAEAEVFARLPKSTVYTVTIPAGTRSLTGGALAETVSWTFTTPPPTLQSSHPGGISAPLAPVFFLSFDQRIDPRSVLPFLAVSANGQPVDIRLATPQEIEADETAHALAEAALESRWLAFVSAAPLPPDADILVRILPGMPSAEGPLVTVTEQSFNFRTYAPLRIEESRCGWYDDRCPPGTPFSIRFNNPIDLQAYREDMLVITPSLPGLRVNVFDNTLEISGETRGQTTYTVTLSAYIRDVFGQTLGREARLTFKVGQADPVLVGPNSPLVTLDPAAPAPVFSVHALNYQELRVRLYAVQPSDWPRYLNYLRDWMNSDSPSALPGEMLSDRTLRLNLPPDTLSQVDIDLAPHLRNGVGHFIVIVEPPRKLLETEDDKWRRYYQTVQVWVQVTQIGLDAFTDPAAMLVWATDLQTGAPLPGVRVRSDRGGADAQTDSNGQARFDIPAGAAYLTATRGPDTALLPRDLGFWGQATWQPYPDVDTLRWYVMDDRKMYRPGEQVSIKGWLRRIGGGTQGDVSLIGDASALVTYQLYDATGNLLTSGQAPLNALGGFDFTLSLPEVVNLGQAQLTLAATSGLPGANYTHTFQVQEFRRPEFEVQTRQETTAPYFIGGSAMLAVEAGYFAGGPLPNAQVTWQVTGTPTNYTPPNWPDFTFGIWQPRWGWWDFGGGFPPFLETESQTFSGFTNAAGVHTLRLDFEPQSGPDAAPRPVSIRAEGTVMDVNRQAWTSATALLVHPADVYVGLRSDRYFVPRGTPLKIDFIVTDLDGAPIPDRPVELRAARMEWVFRDGQWHEDETDIQTCASASGQSPQTCTFETPLGGSYRITALVTDSLGRTNQTTLTRWVSGGQQPPARNVEQEEATLIPDKETYQPGDVAEILVQSPFSPAEGLLTVSRSGTLYTRAFRIEDGTAVVRIPIESAHIPNLNIQVDLVGSAPRTNDQGDPLPDAPARPAFARGQLSLSIPPLERTLTLAVSPDQPALEPGGQTTLNLRLTDSLGRPVADAELAVVVVDEAILALTGYQLTDPLTVFYSVRPALLDSAYGRASIVLADPAVLAAQAADAARMQGVGGALESAPMATAMPFARSAVEDSGKAAAPNAQPEAIQVRADFNPLAVFAPSVRTDARGAASLNITLPDNLTRYRVMVVAVDSGGRRFGTGESSITARLPLMVRPSAPRFLNFGDRFELPVVLQNQTNSPLEVRLLVQSANLELANTAVRVTVPANDRVEVRFPASALQPGTARVQFAAVSGTFADAAAISLPVYTPATTEAFATYGVIDSGVVAQTLLAPSGVIPGYGGLEVTTSATALNALTDAVIYLVEYPYACSEQLGSRVLGIAALRDVLTAFRAAGLPAPDALEDAVARDIETLAGMQNFDGGFPYWRRGFESVPFSTIHVTHALARASQKGFDVPPAMQANALSYLRDIENRYPDWYEQQTRWTLSAYALYVRNLSGDRDSAKAENLIRQAGLENLPLEALGWLWPVVDDRTQLESIRRWVGNRVVETPGAANFITAYSDQTYLLLSSDRRTDAILLDALMGDNPQSDLIPKLVNGLMAHRTKGRWGNTQENVFVLLALDRYFNTYERQTPDFVARLWLGDTYAAEAAFRGYSADRRETRIPMDFLLEKTTGAGRTDLLLSKEGDGRLYYRLGLRYAPAELDLPPVEMGFVVQRVYEAVDDPADVYRDADGIWRIKAGAQVRVRITMFADSRRYHVALVDPLPAGLEIINPDLAVTGGLPPQDPGLPVPFMRSWWWGPWYEHQNLRDERAEAFATLLWDGVYEYTYVARATTPGQFVVPPAKAEEMYSPEVFGRSASDRVIVEE